MNAVCPAIAKLLLQLSAGKVEPPFVEKGAELVWARQPDHHRRRVGHDAKTSLAFQELFLCTFAQCDVARHPPCEGRFAMFVQLDAAMTRHPACASVRPRDAIFVLILATTAFEHLLHKLLRTFAIFRVHNLEHSVKAHWLGLREAEQLSPLVCYPKFVILDVPKPQTEVRRVGRQLNARFAFPQRLLSPPAFRHAGGKCHRSNGEHSRPGLQRKERLVFRSPDEWPETMHCTPNRERRENEDASSGFALREAKGRPNHNRSEDHEWERIIPGRNCKPSAKDRFAEDEQKQ